MGAAKILDIQKKDRSVQSVSNKIYNIDWNTHFPFECKNQVTVRYGNYEQAVGFSKTHLAEIYEQENHDSGFLGQSSDAEGAKTRYLNELADCFLFYKGEKIIGFFVGSIVDWNSYFLRNCSILPEYQGQKLYQEFLVYFLGVLKKHKVVRACGDVSPSNLAHIHILNKLQFNIVGLHMTERWGSLLQFVKYLDRENEKIFLSQFCYGVTPQLSAKNKL